MRDQKDMKEEILNVIRRTPENTSGIANRTGLSIDIVHELLIGLKEEGMVTRLSDGRYELSREPTIAEEEHLNATS